MPDRRGRLQLLRNHIAPLRAFDLAEPAQVGMPYVLRRPPPIPQVRPLHANQCGTAV